MRMRTISTSALSRTMSKKIGFGRDAEDFVRSLGAFTYEERRDSGIMITAICPYADKCFEVRINVSGSGEREKCEFVLLEELTDRLALSCGYIDSSLMPEIEYCADVTKAYFSACSSFAFAPSSLRGLERKLIQKGFASDVAREAVGFISSRGVVDEAEVALRRFELMVKKLWGRSRIISKLREEGFSSEALSSLEDYFQNVDFAENCASLIKKKFGCVPNERHERDKMLASLTRYGYTATEIRKAISMLKD